MINYKVSLKAARINAELTQEDLSKRLGVNVGTIINWENGRTKIPAECFVKFCEEVGAPQEYIFLPYEQVQLDK